MRAFTGLVLPAALLLTTLTGCAESFAGGSSSAVRIPIAPPGLYVDEDVARGYAAYAEALRPAGRWSSDATYGAHWCPARASDEEESFRPYVSHGHWSASDGVEYGAAPGTPFWATDGSTSWQEITEHHGWWIDVSEPAAHFRQPLLKPHATSRGCKRGMIAVASDRWPASSGQRAVDEGKFTVKS